MPVKAARIADAGVVLPIPISPKASRLQPAAICAVASSLPRFRADWVCSRSHGRFNTQIGSSGSHSLVDQPSIVNRGEDAGVDDLQFDLDFASTKQLMAAPPAKKLSTICRVTSLGAILMPCRAMPWSAATPAWWAGGWRSVHSAGSGRAERQFPLIVRGRLAVLSLIDALLNLMFVLTIQRRYIPCPGHINSLCR